MSNNQTPNWFNNVTPWGKRGPRQDRRVVVDGKFVEQTGTIQPVSEPEEVNTALEVAQEAIDAKQAPLSPKEINDLALQIVADEQIEKAAAELGFKGTAPTERKVFANPALGAPYDLSAATVSADSVGSAQGLDAYAKFALGLPEEDRREVFEATFPELKNISESSSQEERNEAMEKLHSRLGISKQGVINVPTESEKLQEQLEPLPVSQATPVVLPEAVQSAAGTDVLDGSAGRAEKAIEITTIEHHEDGSNTVEHIEAEDDPIEPSMAYEEAEKEYRGQ